MASLGLCLPWGFQADINWRVTVSEIPVAGSQHEQGGPVWANYPELTT